MGQYSTINLVLFTPKDNCNAWGNSDIGVAPIWKHDVAVILSSNMSQAKSIGTEESEECRNMALDLGNEKITVWNTLIYENEKIAVSVWYICTTREIPSQPAVSFRIKYRSRNSWVGDWICGSNNSALRATRTHWCKVRLVCKCVMAPKLKATAQKRSERGAEDSYISVTKNVFRKQKLISVQTVNQQKIYPLLLESMVQSKEFLFDNPNADFK